MVKSFWGQNLQISLRYFLAHFCCCLTQRLSLIRGGEGANPPFASADFTAILPSFSVLPLFLYFPTQATDCSRTSLSVYFLSTALHLSIVGLIRKPTSFVSETSRALMKVR